MRITTSKLKRLIRRVILESNTDIFYGEIQNEILALAQDQGGEIVVQDVVSYFSGYADPVDGNPKAAYVGSMGYEEALTIMGDMVASGILIDEHEDFFSVHPDYM